MRLGPLLGVLALLGCKGQTKVAVAADGGGAAATSDGGATAATAELPPPLAELGPLARRGGAPASATIGGEQGGALPLPDGAMLVVSPGAFKGPVAITVERFELDLGKLRADVGGGVAYVYSADRDVESFGAPVTLQVKRPAGPLSAAVWDGAAWKPIAVSDGPVAAVPITHFSRGLLGFVEWLRARTNATDEVILGDDSVEAKKRGRLETHGNDAAKAFHGIGEKLDSVTPRQLCGEMQRTVAGLPPEAFAFPPGNRWRDKDLGLWLIDGRIPFTTTDDLWKMTEAYMEPVRSKFMAAPGRLAPADMLKICIETADGNVPMGVMVCHNFLKEVTYAGRNQPIDRMPAAYGEVANKLMPWRTDDVAPSGYYDKMGPIYHIFAAMAAGTWSQHPGLGNAAAAGEAILRTVQRGGDKPDPEKGAADDCGVDVGWLIRKHETTEYRGGKLPPPPATPWRLEDPPPPPTVATSPDAGVRVVGPDAAVADGGAAADAGSPESLLAQLDAGPAPADQRQTWEGSWKGKAKSSVTMTTTGSEPINTVVEELFEVVVTGGVDAVTMTRSQGGRSLSMELKKTPSNPNAAVGQGASKSNAGGVDTDLKYHLAAFLHTDGRLYVAGRVTVVSTMQGPDGPMTTNLMQEFVAILSKN